MTYLLDTHGFIWFVLDQPQLSNTARQLIQAADNKILVSPISFWEIAIKVSAGKYRLNKPFADFWRRGMSDNSIDVLPIEVRHASRLLNLPMRHKDPFDRMLVAQSLEENIPLISSDASLDAYGVKRIW